MGKIRSVEVRLLRGKIVLRRLYDKINFAGPYSPYVSGRCWVWTGRLSRNGYGRFWTKGRERAAHRVVYEEVVGPIPPKHILDHKCRNRSCVNPDHTEPVTHRVNTLRGEATLFKPKEDYAPLSCPALDMLEPSPSDTGSTFNDAPHSHKRECYTFLAFLAACFVAGMAIHWWLGQ